MEILGRIGGGFGIVIVELFGDSILLRVESGLAREGIVFGETVEDFDVLIRLRRSNP